MVVKNILSQKHLKSWTSQIHPQTLLAFDFDGTLAPIVKDRRRASLSPITRLLLKRLAKSYLCAVVTGRAVKDVRPKLKGISPLIIVGNHGAEVWSKGQREIHSKNIDRKVQGWKKSLENATRSHRGIDIEDKIYSLSIHYVKAKNKTQACRIILEAASALKGAEIIGGKNVFNIVDPKTPHKGQILLKLMKELKAKQALFVGDDVTDEKVFQLRHQPVISVRVGRSSLTSADWYLLRQSDINRLLRTILAL